MPYTIRKQFSFSAAHRLLGLHPDHPCSRQHGHNYKVEIELKIDGPRLNDPGWVRDYRDLDRFKQYLDSEVDHQDLNEIFYGMNTTAENLARTFFIWCHQLWPEVCLTRVSETDKTWAEYYE